LDATPLATVMKFMGAKEDSATGHFKDSFNNVFVVTDNSWFNLTTSKVGTGAVSLFAYHLSLFKNLDYETHKTNLLSDSLDLLEQLNQKMSVKVSVPTEESARTTIVKVPKIKVFKEEPSKEESAKEAPKEEVKNETPALKKPRAAVKKAPAKKSSRKI